MIKYPETTGFDSGHVQKDMLIAERDQTITTLLTKQHLDEQTIAALEEKNHQNNLLIDNLNTNLLIFKLLGVRRNDSRTII